MPLSLCNALLIVLIFSLSVPWIPAYAADDTPSAWSELEQDHRTEKIALQQKKQVAEQAVEQADAAREYALRIDDQKALPVAERALARATQALQHIQKKLALVSARLSAIKTSGIARDTGLHAIASRLYGTVQVKTANGWATLTPETRLESGQEIRTGESSRAELLFGDGSRINLHANTSFMLEHNDGTTSSYKHSLGLIKAYFKKYAGRRFKVRTPTAAVAVRGTEFLVETNATGETALILINGEVELSSLTGQDEIMVHTGEAAIISKDGAIQGPVPYDLKVLQPWWDD